MITQLSAAELAARLRTRQISVVEATTAYLEAIEAKDQEIGAYLTVTPELALEQAKLAQEKIDRGEGGPLTGVPYAAKDNMSTKGVETTCASKILEGYVPVYDGTVIQKLQQEGMVLLGKTNMDEFAMGTSTETSAYKLTRNPIDLERSPGGSSGGSAAAVAGNLAPLSLGSDTGGSIRQPASLCGVVGFKPTYGRCSRYGLVAFASSLDQIGPFGKTVEDVALMTEAITGHDPMDSTSLKDSKVSTANLKQGTLKGKRFALPQEFIGEGTHPDTVAMLEKTIELLQQEGAIVDRINLPSIKFGVTTYYIIAPAEASSNLARFDGIRFGPRLDSEGHIGTVAATRGKLFGHEVKARIMIGTYALSAGYYDAYYLKAQQVRALMRKEFEEAFQTYDAVIGPTSPIPAFKIGELNQDPLALKLLDFCTIPANLTGGPAISLNAGFSGNLPLGFQLIGPVMGDENILSTAYALEKALKVTK